MLLTVIASLSASPLFAQCCCGQCGWRYRVQWTTANVAQQNQSSEPSETATTDAPQEEVATPSEEKPIDTPPIVKMVDPFPRFQNEKDRPKPFKEARDAFRQAIIEKINNRRVAAGLNPLIEDDGMTNSCLYHSQYQQYFGMSHDPSAGCAECVAQGQQTPDAALNAWLMSPAHNAIIMGNGLFIGYGQVGYSHTLRVR